MFGNFFLDAIRIFIYFSFFKNLSNHDAYSMGFNQSPVKNEDLLGQLLLRSSETLIIPFFSYSISPKRMDGFTWNFQGWCILVYLGRKQFFAWWRHFRSEILTIFWFWGCHFVHERSPKLLKISSSNFHGW